MGLHMEKMAFQWEWELGLVLVVRGMRPRANAVEAGV